MDKTELGKFYDYVTKVKKISGESALPPAYIADRPEWIEEMARGRLVDGYFVWATQMSVLHAGEKSVGIGLFVLNPDTYEYLYQNATLRFTAAGAAAIYGLSQDLMTEEEMDEEDFSIDLVESSGKIPLTGAMEVEAIRQVAKSLRAQTEDPMFKEAISADEMAGLIGNLDR